VFTMYVDLEKFVFKVVTTRLKERQLFELTQMWF